MIPPVPPRSARPEAAILIVVLTIAVEVVLSGAELGLWGHPGWRGWAFVLFSFQPWIIETGPPLWPGQPIGMVFTHVFLHVSLWHMAGNMIAFAILAVLLRRSFSGRMFLVLYFLSALGCALVFFLLAPERASMTGASGGLSGLMVIWALALLPGRPKGTARQILRLSATVLALIFLIELLPGPGTAWQAHLGGALSGLGFVLWRFWRA